MNMYLCLVELLLHSLNIYSTAYLQIVKHGIIGRIGIVSCMGSSKQWKVPRCKRHGETVISYPPRLDTVTQSLKLCLLLARNKGSVLSSLSSPHGTKMELCTSWFVKVLSTRTGGALSLSAILTPGPVIAPWQQHGWAWLPPDRERSTLLVLGIYCCRQ